MKISLSLESIIDQTLDIQKRIRDFYEKVAAEAPQGARELPAFLAKRKAQQISALSSIAGAWASSGKPIATDHDALSNLHVIPSIHSKTFTDLSKTLGDIELTDAHSVAAAALAAEKENLLLHHGLRRLLPDALLGRVDAIIEDQNGDILSLHDRMKELHGSIDDFLLAALNGELAAKRFYENAAAKSESEAGRRLFRELADFEQAHFDHIKKILESRNAGRSFALTDAVEAESKAASPAEGELEPNKKGVVEAMIMAIDAEKTARARYDRIAAMLSDPKEKAIFEDLANSERVHQKILEDQFYQLSNEGTISWA